MNEDLTSQNEARMKRAALIVAIMGSFLTPFMVSSVNIALPSIGKEFIADAVLLNWVATSFLLGSSVFLLPFGALADQWGRKRIFSTGISIFTLASGLLILVNSLETLIALRVVQGIGGAMIFSTGAAIVSSIFPAGERGKALGLTVSAVYLGLSLGPFIGGFLTNAFGWRSIFYLPVILGILTLIVLRRNIPQEWMEPAKGPFDLPGTCLFGGGLTALMLSFSMIPRLVGWGFCLVGLTLLSLFLYWETRVSAPILDLSLFRKNRAFAFSNAAALIHYGATYATSFLMSLYLQYTKGLTPGQAGTILICQPILQTIFSPLAGKLSDRFDPRFLASFGMACTTVGLFFFAGLSETTSIATIMGNLAFMGFGFAFFSSPNINCVMGSVEKNRLGVASGILSTMRLLGQMASMAITLLLFALYFGKVQVTPEKYPVFLQCARTAFLCFGILCFFGIGASLARGGLSKGDDSPQ